MFIFFIAKFELLNLPENYDSYTCHKHTVSCILIQWLPEFYFCSIIDYPFCCLYVTLGVPTPYLKSSIWTSQMSSERWRRELGMCQVLDTVMCRCYFNKGSHQLLKGDAAIPTILMMPKLRFRTARNGDILCIFTTEILTAVNLCCFLCLLQMG